ncbi:MAG: pilus (MSHA type) biogenesis protein MshL, partial [Thermodesulfobacteriota bacterium]|nr:pilus (MSHA type) biogenesis protein MshL [Thermodesulfobacteriota bacterium]
MKNMGCARWFIVLFIVLSGCSSNQKVVKKEPLAKSEPPAPEIVVSVPATLDIPEKINSAPESKNGPDFQIKPLVIEMKAGKPYVPVGAELVTQEGKVPLQEVIKRLADLKGLSVSWADDVDQTKPVDVNIRPEDNYWDAFNNILRQLDYSCELKKETIVVKYKETRKYHLVMPFLKEDFKTKVGGDLLGGGASEGRMSGEVKLDVSMAEPLDFWKLIGDNINKIIESSAGKAGDIGGKGYFIIDRPLGIITVTAPRKAHERINKYLENLDEEIHRQVIIEAKIIEVRLEKSSETGINWNELINTTLRGTLSFGKAVAGATSGVIYPFPHKDGFISKVTLQDDDFSVMLKALKKHGETNILSNPKISLLNGHGATITVGENVTYIDKVETTTTGSGGTLETTFSVSTNTILSGIGMAVMANIIADDEIILYIVPITSELGEPIEYRTFTGAGTQAEVGLPRVRLREMSTYAKLHDGQTLIIGGLIDTVMYDDEEGLPILGDIPFLGRLFKVVTKKEKKRELVILLKPIIVGWGTGLG